MLDNALDEANLISTVVMLMIFFQSHSVYPAPEHMTYLMDLCNLYSRMFSLSYRLIFRAGNEDGHEYMLSAWFQNTSF